MGAQTTEGVGTALLPLTNTYTWHALGYDGTGVNLAVFDFGFTGWATRQTGGDLPSGGNLVNKDYSSAYSFSPDTSGYAHGAACAETAYDMAPGSTVYLYAWGTDAEFASAVDDYRNNVSGKRVATMSISWVNAGPYDGTGSTSTLARSTPGRRASSGPTRPATIRRNTIPGPRLGTATANCRLWHRQYRRDRARRLHSLWNLASGTTLRIYLEWNDWNADRTGNQNHVDYDICLWRWTGSAWFSIGCTATRQCTTTATPTEGLSYTVPSGGKLWNNYPALYIQAAPTTSATG